MTRLAAILIVLSALIAQSFGQRELIMHGIEDSVKQFTTPNYPNNYANYMKIRHVIVAPKGSNILLSFNTAFGFEKLNGYCIDYVTVFNAENFDQVQTMGSCRPRTSDLGDSFCGSDVPTGKIHGGEKMIVEFCSDYSDIFVGASITWEIEGSSTGGGGSPAADQCQASCGCPCQCSCPTTCQSPTTPLPTTTKAPPTPSTNPTPPANSCGVSSPNYPASVPIDANGNIMGVQGIVGGDDAMPHSLPWMVSFGFCGGALVSDQWVITAAHCISDDLNQMSLKLGQHSSQNDLPWLPVTIAKKHPNYNSNNMANDIALVKLASPVTFTDKVKPICLPTATDNWQNSEENALIAGWGRVKTGGDASSKLLQAIVKIVPKATCNTKYGGIITETMMCAGAPGKDTCQGDSGGPFMVRKDNRYVLAGVVSWGYGCADPLYPGVYNHVPTMRQWIRSETGL